MLRFYRLEGKIPVQISMEEWATGAHLKPGEQPAWRVAYDEIGEVQVSTVFLGQDVGLGAGKPLVFETMIFGGEHDEFQVRSSTWEEAEEWHAAAVAMIRGEG